MRSVWIFYQKEMLEAVRSYRLIWIPVVFILLGIMQPLTAYYMPEILGAAGNVPPGMLENYEVPSAAAVMVQALGQYSTIGMLVLALITMNSISGERYSGSAEMVLVRPLTPLAMVVAKWAALLTVLMLALGLGASGAAYYVMELIGPLSWGGISAAAGLYGLWLMCAVSLTLLFSAFLRATAAAFLGLLSAVAFSLAHSLLPAWFDWTPAALPGLSAAMLLEDGGALRLGPLLSAPLFIISCIASAALLLRRKQLPG
ncbi:ABC transporter permease subunit [Paenibacillus albidus]|uniref:ABC transporter permease n=1 Tax=Paenibacillus albidus TaxID=2041023 RepID=UPI001BEAF61D|nr:ABC transporter permease subunit [Paenibacillus albidus]MBT2292460.1 ABC transporter permease subunit [Paenibacillus albidus]